MELTTSEFSKRDEAESWWKEMFDSDGAQGSMNGVAKQCHIMS